VLVAVSRVDEQRVLILGLEGAELARLVGGEALRIDLVAENAPGLEGWRVTILAPDDTSAALAHLEDT